VISGQRGKVMEGIRAKVVQEAAQIGVEIIDVRLKRVDYVEQINNSVYERMKAERTAWPTNCVRPVRPSRRRSAPMLIASAP
jgi:methionine synthase II (cobalamin-independent)